MGREVKRVPLNFNWPMNKTWGGFLNPHYKKCPDCGGSGATMASERLSDLVGLLMLSGSDAAKGRCHPYFYQMPGLYNSEGKIPSKDLAELTGKLAGRGPDLMGHDAIDRWSATAKIIKAAGLPKSWGTCKTCEGSGCAPENRKAYNRWKPKNPPKGVGWQMWETVSEGSPISPVFATPEKLARWLADNGASSCGSSTATYEQWLTMIQAGWCMTMAVVNGKMMSGVEMASADIAAKPSE